MAEPSFQTDESGVPDVPDAGTLRVRGTVRYAEAPAFRRVLLGWIERSAASRLIVELEQVESMDTAGAAVLVEALLYGRERSKRVLLCSPGRSVLQLFRLAGFEEALRACCPSPADALRRLSG